MTMTRRWCFAVIYGAILIVVTLVGIEIVAGFFAPPWPARLLRTIEPINDATAYKSIIDKPWITKRYNSWGMNDIERSVAKPPGTTFRSIFVGDSLVEFGLNRLTVPAAVEQRAEQSGLKGFEAIDLGISGTDPRSYYYRTRDVALSLSPDALMVFFFCGNDFMPPDEGFDAALPWLDESPGGSILGNVMPRTDWLLVNRFRLSEFLRGNKPIPGEFDQLYAIVRLPLEQRSRALAEHMKKYYYPALSVDDLAELFSRGDNRFWRLFDKRPYDQEYLMGWLPNLMIASEKIRGDGLVAIRTPEDAAKYVSDAEIGATLSWLQAMARLAQDHKVPLRLFIIPTANVSPDFVEFWKPWPRYFSWYVLSEVRRKRLVAALGRTGVPFVDLTSDLEGTTGTYRVSDAHWTEKGTGIAADRAYREIEKIRAR
ncbi:MAG: hypothetical protein JOY81_07780 [Alphaproteobacteria bacterium]|nr:hypothetical protein [Alphaproteobacteria bacterium]